MNSLNDPIKLLARRFVSLPANVRIEIAGRLLRLREEKQGSKETRGRARSYGERKKSFLEQFWEEVEAAHGDNLYPTNPFAGSAAWLPPYASKQCQGECLAYS